MVSFPGVYNLKDQLVPLYESKGDFQWPQKKKNRIFLPEKRSEDAKLLMKKIKTLSSVNR